MKYGLIILLRYPINVKGAPFEEEENDDLHLKLMKTAACVLNCFCNCILTTWPRPIFSCSQISKKCSLGANLAIESDLF